MLRYKHHIALRSVLSFQSPQLGLCGRSAPLWYFYPGGVIPFVEVWLKKYHGKTMVPIEVPEILRTREFLDRIYEFMDRNKLPSYEKGHYFVELSGGVACISRRS